MGVGSVPSGGGQPVDTGPDGPQGPSGPEGSGTPPPSGTGGAEGTGTPGGEEGLDFGGELFGGTEPPPDGADGETSDLAARQLCNTIALRTTESTAARGQILTSHADSMRGDARARADTSARAESDTYRADTRTEVRHSTLGEAFQSGDRRAIDSFFKNVLGGNRESGNRPPPTTTTAAQPQATPTPTGTMTPTPRGEAGARAEGTPPPPNQPVFPNATGRLSTLTQSRMDQLHARLAGMPEGPQKTQAQQLESRLRAAIASGNETEAAQILEQLSAMGIEMGEEGEAGEVGEEAEVEEGEGAEDGEGEGTSVGRRGEGTGEPVRLAKTHLSDETLQQGMVVFHGGDSAHGEEGDHLTRMGTGLRTICSGRGTEAAARLSTDDAVRGVLDRGGEGEGDAAGGGSHDSSVEFGSLVDTDGSLARTGMRLDTAAAGIGGSYGVRTEDGRFIPQWMAMSEHGGLPPGVRAAIARDAGLRTRFGAEAVSGASAGRTGDLWAGMRC